MVGHTHEDVDAMFGNFGKWLRKHNAHTVPGNVFWFIYAIVTVISNTLALLQGCKEANKTVGCATVLSSISDVKSWLLPCTDQLYNHSHPHIFKFNKGSRLPISTEMHYKRWNEDKWEPEGQPGLKLLKVPAGNFAILICLIYPLLMHRLCQLGVQKT